MSRTRGHRNCSRRNCMMCTRRAKNAFKLAKKAPPKPELEAAAKDKSRT